MTEDTKKTLAEAAKELERTSNGTPIEKIVLALVREIVPAEPAKPAKADAK